VPKGIELKDRIRAIVKNNLPFRKQIRALKRAIVPYRSNPKNDETLLAHSLFIVDALKRTGADLATSTLVEIGSGWVPVLPLVFRMAGASEIVTLDQDRLMDKNTFLHAINYISLNLQRLLDQTGVRGSMLSISRLPSRHARDFNSLCRAAGVTYLAPADFMDLAPGSADFIVSRTVLEHIPEELLAMIFKHAANVLRPGGMMCHLIDMSDHFEHKDKSLSRVDMLRYSTKDWRARTRDPQDYQNRLRRFDFLRILDNTGWEVLKVTGDPDARAVTDLKAMKIMPRYAGVAHEELAILTSLVVARRKINGSTSP
jgi:hypothetical protein